MLEIQIIVLAVLLLWQEFDPDTMFEVREGDYITVVIFWENSHAYSHFMLHLFFVYKQEIAALYINILYQCESETLSVEIDKHLKIKNNKLGLRLGSAQV